MPSQPEWIPEFVDHACRTLRLFDEDAPIGCHYFSEGETHEVSLFVSSTEVVGGPNDGKRINSRYIVDVVELMTLLDEVESITWQAHIIDEDDDLGPHLSVSGIYHGESVWLRVLGETPDEFLPGRLAIVAEKKFVNIWED
ncbi:hypothetical protein N8590_02885 [bacterium]|jgi:hypothetical protein|nr:hypothetical protein [Planctomicrobium sp.]MDA7527911.1 hypothetical protein [bacterium]MDB4802423.1 hypothetical protein [bacterium]